MDVFNVGPNLFFPQTPSFFISQVDPVFRPPSSTQSYYETELRRCSHVDLHLPIEPPSSTQSHYETELRRCSHVDLHLPIEPPSSSQSHYETELRRCSHVDLHLPIEPLSSTQSHYETELRRCSHVDLHLPVEPVVEQQVVGHSHPLWLHRMSLPIVVVAYVTYYGRETHQT